jgi:hypothetical protein
VVGLGGVVALERQGVHEYAAVDGVDWAWQQQKSGFNKKWVRQEVSSTRSGFGKK